MHSQTWVTPKISQVIIVQIDFVVIRSAKLYLATLGAIVHGHYGEILSKEDPLVTFIYEKSRFSDISQGLPKVKQVLEVCSIDSISLKLENKLLTRILGNTWGFLIGIRLNIVQSRVSFVDKIKKVINPRICRSITDP